MCLGNPDICRCSACFHARLQPKEYAYKYPILTPGPFYYSLKKIEEDEKERYSALKKIEEKEKESTKKSIREILKKNGLIKDD